MATNKERRFRKRDKEKLGALIERV
jgi:hypothetical protein